MLLFLEIVYDLFRIACDYKLFVRGDKEYVGEVKSLTAYGAFAEIVPGADGLIHISQIADRKIGKPADVLEIGQVVDAKITDIDMENHKISLSIRALIEKEEEVAEEVAEEEAVEAVEAEEATEEASE